MNEAVFLALLKDLVCFFLGDIAAALLGLHHVISHIAHCDTPVMEVIRASLIICHA